MSEVSTHSIAEFATGCDAPVQDRIVQQRLARVPGYCMICATGWAFFACYYLVRSAMATFALCFVEAILCLSMWAISRTSSSSRNRIGTLHLCIVTAGLTLECLISGVWTSNTIPYLCCVAIIAAHQSGIRAAAIWSVVLAVIVGWLHFGIDPNQWPMLRTPNSLDNATGYIGLALLVAWVAARAEWVATQYYIRLNESATELAHRASELSRVAQIDQLTGLANRYHFQNILADTVKHHQHTGGSVGLLMLDLDLFKEVNDTMGHRAGDSVLQTISQRLLGVVGERDLVARLGGDEFMVLSAPAAPTTLIETGNKIARAVEEPIKVGHREVRTKVSIGIASLPEHAQDIQELMARADLAMYEAKDAGASMRMYRPAMTQALMRRRELAHNLETALQNDEFFLLYQPQVCVKSGTIHGVEALLRWEHDGELIGPNEFIPILEASNGIQEVGRWALMAACRQAKQWHEEGLVCSISVNVSPRQFQSPRFTGDVFEVLNESRLHGKYLDLEITEGVMVDKLSATHDKLQRLKATGVQISIDDFGTGYSSLAYLKHLPLDRLKIDRAFVRDVPDRDDGAIASAVISLAKNMEVHVLAEGVETEAQLAFLRERECDLFQGYLFSKPLSTDDCHALLKRNLRPDVPAVITS